MSDRLLTEGGSENPEKVDIQWKPLVVYENIDFSESNNQFPEPFATKEEVFGLLSGSESWTLCSKGDPIFSRAFVQCGAALVRNRNTGLITLIHESVWSESADVAMALQRDDDVDVVTIHGPFGGLNLSSVKYAHEKPPQDAIENIKSFDKKSSRKYGVESGSEENLVHLFGNRSALIGLSENDVQNAVERIKDGGSAKGLTQEIGEINIPVSKAIGNRWYLLYRPEENIIWIYESGARKLFKYRGF